MPKKYPPLTPKQICKILERNGFKLKNSRGDHSIYENDNGTNVQVDMGVRDFRTPGMKIIINNSGLSREQFYGSTKATAKKIGIKYKKSP